MIHKALSMNTHLLAKQRVAGTTAGILLATTLAWDATVSASSHREAPYITKYPQVDATDFYLFNSYEPGREEFITILANYIPLQAAYGGPNYFPLDQNAIYEIHIDNDGDAIDDIRFQFDFSLTGSDDIPQFIVGSGDKQRQLPSVLKNVAGISSESANGLAQKEFYRISMLRDPAGNADKAYITNLHGGSPDFARPFDYSGTKTYGGPGAYSTYAESFIHDILLPGCDTAGKVFVGQRLDSFKLALGEIFDLVNLVPIEGDSVPGAGDGSGFPGGVTQDPARNDLLRNNITTIAMELPKHCVTGQGNGVIGGWTSASLRQTTVLHPHPTLLRPEITAGRWTQVSRLGSFLVNELFIGYPDKDRFNNSKPDNDAQFTDYVTNPVFPEIINVLFKDAVNSTLGSNIASLAPSNFPRRDLVAGFLTGVEGLNQMQQITPSEMLRLNTAIAATAREHQHPLGVAAGDLAGFPNGRRPGDDAVDIALRVAMGALCHPLPLGEGGSAINLGLCSPADAPIGNVPLTDGVPIHATEFENRFPYLLTPYPGSPSGSAIPQPRD